MYIYFYIYIVKDKIRYEFMLNSNSGPQVFI